MFWTGNRYVSSEGHQFKSRPWEHVFDYWNFRLSYREAGTEEKELNGNIIQDVLYPMAPHPLQATIPPKTQTRIPQCLNAQYEPSSLNEFYHSVKILFLAIGS